MQCSSTVTALSADAGAVLFTTASIAGTAVGTPVSTSDGQYILVTTNPTLNTGLFTAFDISKPNEPAYSFEIAESRVSAIGAYWNPVQGYVILH